MTMFSMRILSLFSLLVTTDLRQAVLLAEGGKSAGDGGVYRWTEEPTPDPGRCQGAFHGGIWPQRSRGKS